MATQSVSQTEPIEQAAAESPKPPVEAAAETKPRGRRKQYVLKGGPSAIAVQLFAIDEKYEMRSVDLLPAVFKLFPVSCSEYTG